MFVEPEINPPGGGQCVAAWALEALRDEYAIDLLTWTRVDFDAINRFYGTALKSSDYKTWSAPAWLNWVVSLDPDPWDFQRLPILMRIAKSRRGKYDLIISFCDEVDFGVPAIQYIHFPYLARIYREQQRLEKMTGWLGQIRAAIYTHRPWRLISGFLFERMRANITLVNSQWTGEHVRREFSIEPIVLYPPVPGDFPTVPWEARENGFVCIGRLSSEKKYERIISILSAVRAHRHDIHLHIIGKAQPHRGAEIYYRQLLDLIQEHSNWISLEEDISRAELVHLVAHHRYGIHGMPEEHFGVAVAEMVRGGCVVFVPNDGGQVEIVGEDERLCYNTGKEAVEKIAQVLGDANAQGELRAKLAERGKEFSPEKLGEHLRSIVAKVLEERA